MLIKQSFNKYSGFNETMMLKKISGGTVHKALDDLKKALISDPLALEKWKDITSLARNEWICWIESVKRLETRKIHIERAITELKEGMSRPCCWYGCIHRKDKPVSPSVQKLILNKQLK